MNIREETKVITEAVKKIMGQAVENMLYRVYYDAYNKGYDEGYERGREDEHNEPGVKRNGHKLS